MASHTAVPGAGTAPDAAVAALDTAVQDVIASFEGDIPFGAAAGMLERVKAVHAQVDALKVALLAPLAQMKPRANCSKRAARKA